MSVLIKGMEMPKSCESCPCKTADAFGGLGCQATGYIPLRKVNQDRPDNCPLVEIPPHGRLIDVKSLETMNFTDGMYDAENKLFVPFVEVASAIFDAPTIIEAEEGE